MNQIDELFKQVHHAHRKGDLGEDFQDRVFEKIRKKKIQRKVTVGTSIGFALMGFVFGFYLFSPGPRPAPNLRAKSETSDLKSLMRYYPVEPLEASDRTGGKEEVPVLEDVYFSSFDGNANYALEQVSYTEEKGGI